jgi:hypothetical protein
VVDPSRAARRAISWQSNVDRALRTVKGLSEGVLLGLLSGESLDEIDRQYYDGIAQYADPTYNRRGLQDWEERGVDRWFADCRRIVVIGAGGGREVLALARLGYDVVGFECNERLVRAANELLEAEGCTRCVARMERSTWPDAPAAFDGCVIGWGTYMLIRGRGRRVAFLTAARRSLAPRAPILLSYFVRAGMAARFRTSAWTANTVLKLRGRPGAWIPDDALVPNYVHFFDKDEVGKELSAAGLELVDMGDTSYGWAVARTPATS